MHERDVAYKIAGIVASLYYKVEPPEWEDVKAVNNPGHSLVPKPNPGHALTCTGALTLCDCGNWCCP